MLNHDLLSGNAHHLSIEGLPYVVQDIITTYAKALNCPTEFVTGAAMAAAAQAAGNRFVWDNVQYKCYPQFYTALLGDSTANKTSSIRAMYKPLENADRQSYIEWQQATAEKKNEDRARTPYQIGVLQDYTLEAYQDALKFNPNGVTAFADEILSFFGNFNKYRSGADEKFFLSTFGNYTDYKKIRRNVGLDLISHPIVRIIGGIQPDILAPTFAGSTMLADGMLPRFLWYGVPSDFKLDERPEQVNTWTAETAWGNIINTLLSHTDTTNIVFDEDAQRLYVDYKAIHNKAKNAKTLYGYEAAVCGKLEIYAIIWAMTSRLLRYASDGDGGGDTLYISGWDMERSIKCMDYFRATAMDVYQIIKGGVKLSKSDCIRGLRDDITNQSMFAESIGVSQQYISKLLSKK